MIHKRGEKKLPENPTHHKPQGMNMCVVRRPVSRLGIESNYLGSYLMLPT